MRKNILSVDAGKGFTKYARTEENGDIYYDQFETRYTKLEDLNDTELIGKDSFKVEYKDEKFVIGKQADKDLRNERTKKNEIHRLCSLIAVTQLLKPVENNNQEIPKIYLVVSMPGTSYKSKKLREEFKKYYLGEKTEEIIVNNNLYKFEIENVIVMPEGAGFLFCHTDLCKGRTAVVDIGHLNIGLTTFNEQNIEKLVSLDEGGEVLEQNAIEKMESEIGEEVERSVIIDTLKKGYYTQFGDKVENTDSIISQVKLDYVDSLVDKAKAKGVRLADMHNIYFIGGTSLLLKNDIDNHDKLSKTGSVLDDGKWITVIGNLIYAEGSVNSDNK